MARAAASRRDVGSNPTLSTGSLQFVTFLPLINSLGENNGIHWNLWF